MNFTPEQITKAKAAKSAEELIALAKENGIALTEEEAAKYFADLHKEGELADEELDNVAGGSFCYNGSSYSTGEDSFGLLIVTIGNSCPMAEDSFGRVGVSGTCFKCSHSYTTNGVTWYCRARKYKNDPYNP